MSEPSDAVAALASLDTDGERSQTQGELAGVLLELDAAEDAVAYARTAKRLADIADVLVHSKRLADSYRAALVLARHAFDEPSRPPRMRAEAEDRLRRLFRTEAMLKFALERASSSAGTESVPAAKLLVGLGAAVVARLLDAQERSNGPERAQITALLIATGEHALPVLIEELCSLEPVRVRRASRLLGEMQHPRSVEALLGQLAHPDPMVQKEIARALAWIGTDPAVEGLIAALRGRAELAEIAAAALGHCAHASAVPALCTVASPRSSQPEAVRREALRSLGRLRSPQAVPVLREVLDHSTLFRRKKTRALRVAAAHALARIGGEAAFAALEAHAQRGDPPVRSACNEALRLLSRS